VWGGGGICSREEQVELQVEVENAGIMAPALPVAGHLPRAGRTRVQPARTGRAEDDTTVMSHCGTVTVMVSPAARATWHSESLSRRLAGGV
jgi:hypothetical protein